MSPTTSVFYLKVQRVEQFCLFELSWGRGQQLSVTVPYPETLSTLYQEWSSVYLTFYKTALRGRVAQNGTIAPPPVDWHAKLVQAQAKLLYEFHNWLRCAELYEIRSCIAQAARHGEREKEGEGETRRIPPFVEVFLACSPLDLARLPWEAWEIGTEFAATGKIRFFRTPTNIQQVTVTPQRRRRRARILAILGDDTGLNFQADKEAVRSLASVAEIKFVGWQPDKDTNALKEEIAKERGLQFALFNSCNGLSLANTLISLGLSQVAVMREPIHNDVAQEFLVRFLQRLAELKDVHEALVGACQYLKLEKHLTYPGAYLIPSLFRHPDAPLFRIQPFGIKGPILDWLRKNSQPIALATLAFVSWQLPVQSFLLEQRVLVQAIYRNLTQQVEITQQPPVLVVQIDIDSIREAKLPYPAVPMDRSYLARLVDKLSTMNAKVVGIDYLL